MYVVRQYLFVCNMISSSSGSYYSVKCMCLELWSEHKPSAWVEGSPTNTSSAKLQHKKNTVALPLTAACSNHLRARTREENNNTNLCSAYPEILNQIIEHHCGMHNIRTNILIYNNNNNKSNH